MKIFSAIILAAVSIACTCNGFIVVPKQTFIPVQVARNVPFALSPQNPLVDRAAQNGRIVSFASNQMIPWKVDDSVEDKLDYRKYGDNLPRNLFYLTANEMDDKFKEGEVDGYLKKLKGMGIKTLRRLKPLLNIEHDSPKAQDTRGIVGRLFINTFVLLDMIREASIKLCTTINPPKPYNVNATCTPIYGLEKQYNSTMNHSTALLFRSWDCYKSSLPQRKLQRKWGDLGGKHICLAENEYWAREKDLDLMVDSLFHTRGNKRALIKYISAPPESGKTSSVAAAFVRSTQNDNEMERFSYYFYLACNNNNDRNFRYGGRVSRFKWRAEQQGAQFALECVEKLLNMEKFDPNKKVSPAKSIDEASRRITELLEHHNIRGRILFHLDEHEEMNTNPNFRFGAMATLASVIYATIISTFKARRRIPTEILTKSSSFFQDPVPFPPLDVRRVVQTLEQFSFPVKSFSVENKRLYATLMLRLAFYLSKKLNIIHLNIDEKFETFKSEFYEASECARQKPLNQTAVRKGLEACIVKCKVPNVLIYDSNAAELMIGIPEANYNDVKVPSASVFRSLGYVYITSSLNELLERNLPRRKPGYSAFSKGRDRFLSFLWEGINVISGTPLECAYAWTLCAFAIAKQYRYIRIPNTSITLSIKCDKLEPGRLFDNSSVGSFSEERANNLDIHTIYFVNEGSGSQSTSHPICNIFFRTEANELVMIDVTGSANKQMIEKKINQKRDFLEQHTHNIFELRCFVLAPLYDGEYDGNGSSMLVSGESARFLLGGLAPILSWYHEDWETDDVIEI